MVYVEVLLLAFALAADAFTVGAALGLRFRAPRQIFRLAFHFGLFQALLPLAGALLGSLLLGAIERADHWIAFGLLAALGVRMIHAGARGPEPDVRQVDLTRGWNLVGFSTAVSIDALAAGFSLPAARAPIPLSVLTFGVVTGIATVVAMRLAGPIARRLGSRVEIVAGCVLVGIGLKILNDHVHFLMP